ncbi:MAG TPA: DUF2911 domain-containing protein [Acidobacteriota bacterium]|jgi:hypothetical protein
MRRLSFVVLLSIFMLVLIAPSHTAAGPKANRGLASVTINGKKISIDYGQPEMKGRDLLGMAPVGTVWRMGMNEATELKTEVALKFKDLTVKPGQYTLWAKRTGADNWKLIVNSKTGIWGTEYDSKSDLGSTPLTSTKLTPPVERFTISLSATGNKGTLEMSWGTTKLSASFMAQ